MLQGVDNGFHQGFDGAYVYGLVDGVCIIHLGTYRHGIEVGILDDEIGAFQGSFGFLHIGIGVHFLIVLQYHLIERTFVWRVPGGRVGTFLGTHPHLGGFGQEAVFLVEHPLVVEGAEHVLDFQRAAR